MPDPDKLPPTEQSDWFETTHWSVVSMAGESSTTLARAALEKLCASYWSPLYSYVRHKGHDEHEAQDLTQEFFARLLARNDFAGLDPSRGRFRAFLLAAINHFLAKEWRKARALKRGAGQRHFSLDPGTGEERQAEAYAGEAAPERLFDRRWAETVLERAAARLRDEFIGDHRAEQFRELNVFLSLPAVPGDYSRVAARLNMTEAAVAKAVERLRRRYRELARQEIAQTVATPAEVDDEMRYLLEVLK